MKQRGIGLFSIYEAVEAVKGRLVTDLFPSLLYIAIWGLYIKIFYDFQRE